MSSIPNSRVDTAPLILTLRMDAPSEQFFNSQRTRYFPEAINFLSAHVTLFHHLPGLEQREIMLVLDEALAHHRSFPVEVTGLRNLGRGVAYTLESTALLRLRATLAERWLAWLTAQDRQRYKPHLTVQNKVAPEEARQTLAHLSEAFHVFQIQAVGVDLWRYLNGPWQHVTTVRFTPAL